jgi:hypothetical protein
VSFIINAVQAEEFPMADKASDAERSEVVMVFMGICSVMIGRELGRFDNKDSKVSLPMVLVT